MKKVDVEMTLSQEVRYKNNFHMETFVHYFEL